MAKTPPPPVTPERLRKQGTTALLEVLLAPLFLGIPIAFVFVPIIEFHAVWKGHKIGKQLRAQKAKVSYGAEFAVGLGTLIGLFTLLYAAAQIGVMLEKS